ncbi:MAG: MerR family transcriptional regulator [Lachnospiraceae bacterium]|nr:MerR family transcriptional regulator [Lachnospiraceae bacterium]
MNNGYMKTGEFAKACGVKKATIVHYAKIGILEPEMIAENGYAYYSPGQLYDFELIHVLKEMKIPLEEIKDYIENRNGNAQSCRKILAKKLKELQDYRKDLEALERIVSNTIKDIDEYENVRIGVIEEIHKEKETPLYIYKMPYRTADEAFSMPAAVRDFISYVTNSFRYENINVVEVVMHKHVMDETFQKTFGGFVARKDSIEDPTKVMFMPAGTYLTVAGAKGGNDIVDLYRDLKKYADENGYEVVGNGYERDLLSHIVERDRTNYLVRCYIHVKSKEK